MMKYILLCIIYLFSFSVLAQSESKAFEFYFSGKYFDAEKSFELLLNVAETKTQKASTLKMLGICQYMQGKRALAEKTFLSAKSLDSSLVIKSDEVLDATVIEFFNQIKSKKIAKNIPKQVEKKAEQKAENKVEKRVEQKTFVTINSKEPASIILDGGQEVASGKTFEFKPGKLNIKVEKDGFVHLKENLNVVYGVNNIFTLNLIPVAKKIESKPLIATTPVIQKPEELSAKPKAQEKLAVKEQKEQKELSKLQGSKTEQPLHKASQILSKNHLSSQNEEHLKQIEDKKSNHDQNSTPIYLTLLPFGIGHYAQKDYVLGVLSTSIQLGALAFSFTTQSQRVNLQNSSPSEGDYESTKDKIDQLYTQQTIGLGIFGLTYLSSAIYSFLHRDQIDTSLAWQVDIAPPLFNSKKPWFITWHKLL